MPSSILIIDQGTDAVALQDAGNALRSRAAAVARKLRQTIRDEFMIGELKSNIKEALNPQLNNYLND